MKHLYFLLICIGTIGIQSCTPKDMHTNHVEANQFYPSSKPCTRWWWFATEIKNSDIKHQLDWAKENNFGGVEIAWVYPLYRYQRMYERSYNRFYPKDTTAQKWLSPEWIEAVVYTKQYAESIGLACDFTFGSAWPVSAANIKPEHRTQVYGDSSFQQVLTFSWEWPDTQYVINHLDPDAFKSFSKPIEAALSEALKGEKSALFTDSWEIKMNDKYKVWTPGFEKSFLKEFGYDIIPYMDKGIDSFPDVRYDYMLHIDEYVTNGFYKPYVEKCRELGAWSRVQCLASPTDVMTTYGLVDIPETEAMLNNPNYSRIVSSAASLAGKSMVSSESFTCMYGFPSTYLRQEQTADLKMVADALFAQGVNQHFYHGMPYNPEGSDTIEFFATTYFGPGSSLSEELPAFNKYIEKVSGIMQKGRTYSDVAVYIPYEDGIMKGAYPQERQRVWVWGEYELRYVFMPEETKGYHPLWINRSFLEKAEWRDGKLHVEDNQFSCLYIDVNYMDTRAVKQVLNLAQKGLPVILKKNPVQPGKNKDTQYGAYLKSLNALPNVSAGFNDIVKHPPLIQGETIPDYWCRVDKDGNYYIFMAQLKSQDLKYPIYSGQSFMEKSDRFGLNFNIDNNSFMQHIELKPYQSMVLKVSSDRIVERLDISFVPKDPIIRPKEKQKMNF